MEIAWAFPEDFCMPLTTSHPLGRKTFFSKLFRMNIIKFFYLIAAILGTVIPWTPFLPFLIEYNFSPNSILDALYTDGATSGLSNDFFISCVVFAIFVIRDSKSLNIKYAWILIPAAPLIGLSMALPTYLLMRESSNEQVNSNG
ncbi:MAG: DUF2834 domain-containing protein [Cyanobacteria bacterium P01_G01_bin.54]